jgi:CDP-diacylglycerol---serine O-phosphatidyltransferase
MNRSRRPPYILVLPSLFTTGNLFCGYYAVLMGVSGRLTYAAYAIFLAMVFDSLDGRVARMTKTQSKFGVEYDSLADVVSFAFAPAIICYSWSLQGLGRLGFGAAFFYLACGALRLARFNTVTDSIPKSYFIGLPSPAAAAALAAVVLARHDLGIVEPPQWLVGLVVVLGVLMVSNIRYPSFKDFDLRERRRYPLLVFLVGALVFVIWEPELAAVALLGYYVFWGVLRESLSALRRLVSRRPRLGRAAGPTAGPSTGSATEAHPELEE